MAKKDPVSIHTAAVWGRGQVTLEARARELATLLDASKGARMDTLEADRELRGAIVLACLPVLPAILPAHVLRIDAKASSCELSRDGTLHDITGQVRALDVAETLSRLIDARLATGRDQNGIDTLRTRAAILRGLTGALRGLMQNSK